MQYERLRPLLETHQKIIDIMAPENLRHATEGPTQKGNWTL
jgi:hypothetical protein